MALAINLSPWRTPLLRRVAACVALVAIGFHVLTMALHGPASAMAQASHHMAAPCHGDMDVADAPMKHDPGKTAEHRPMVCPICQGLFGQAYLPQAITGIWAPLPGVAVAFFERTDVPPPRLVLAGISARGPPHSV